MPNKHLTQFVDFSLTSNQEKMKQKDNENQLNQVFFSFAFTFHRLIFIDIRYSCI